ncbi:MAG: helix-turn-helix transcriptional regulator, partial [Lachnoclostridium sp.]|nr:helix-turn-helix transcriptional regulator [Lachnoclostridium sp.]
MATFNERLKELRDGSDLLSKDVADELGINASRLSYYLVPGREPPYELLVKIADYFNVTTDYLVGRSNYKTFEDQLTAQEIQSKTNTVSMKRVSFREDKVENLSVALHDLLRRLADAEIGKDSKDN